MNRECIKPVYVKIILSYVYPIYFIYSEKLRKKNIFIFLAFTRRAFKAPTVVISGSGTVAK